MLHKKSDRIKGLIEEINKKTENSALIIEGVKDKKALEKIGISADFFLLNRYRRSLHECAEEIAENHDQAFLFLDQDPKGKKLTAVLRKYLRECRVKANTKLARRLLLLAKTDKIEGLSSALRQLL